MCARVSPQWTITELACYTYSLVSVPLYDTLGLEAITYILDKGKATTFWCLLPPPSSFSPIWWSLALPF